MKQFISWFNQIAPRENLALSALARAGVAHLYKVLSQSLGQPTLIDLIISKAKLFDQFRDQINPRQEKVISRIM
jgi:hypothetical protein